jgi:hypothetical protein
MDEILKIFRQIAYEGRKVRLLNLYKGIPVSYAASIVNIGEVSVTVRTEKIQLVAMYLAKETFVQNTKFPQLVRAGVVLVNPDKMDAMLSRFSYQPERLGQITRVRLQPGAPVPGQVVSEQSSPLEAELIDVSLHGVGILVDENKVQGGCQAGQQIQVQLQLPAIISLEEPAEPQTITLQGTIVNARIVNAPNGLEGGKCRLGIELHPEHPARLELARFISQRQMELLREVHSIYELIRLETQE